MKNLDIIIRTHNTSNVHTDRQRYCEIDKTTLIAGCLKSLVTSCNGVLDWNIKFTILDDHSTDELFVKLDDVFSCTIFPYEIVNLEESGYNYSALQQFKYCKDSNADLVYSIEDDYLHCPSAISEMILSYEIFKINAQKEVCVYPFDMPDDYIAPWIEPCYVVHGSHRHWRTGSWTTNSMMCSPKIFQDEDNWKLFETLALKYNPQTHEVHEGNTICSIWKNKVPRFSPIPSLALHMQFDTQIDPYIDWKYWWNNYAKI